MIRALIILVALAGIFTIAQAQSYPSRPVRVVVGFSPGATADIFARLVGQKLGEDLGQPVLIDNVTGAGGTIAATQVAKAAPDGHTLMFMGLSLVYGPAMYRGLSYDAVRDFAPVALVAVVPNVLFVHPSVAVRSLPELIAMAKAKPGALTYASGGTGSTSQLATELFKSMAGVNIQEVPYRSTAQALTESMAGQVSMYYPGLASALPHIRAGRVRALAVSGSSRSAIAPDIPTVAETLPGYDASSWFGFTAPVATPQDLVRRLNAGVVRVVRTPDMVERMAAQGAEAVGSTPDQFGEAIRVGAAKWSKLIQDLGIKTD